MVICDAERKGRVGDSKWEMLAQHRSIIWNGRRGGRRTVRRYRRVNTVCLMSGGMIEEGGASRYIHKVSPANWIHNSA